MRKTIIAAMLATTALGSTPAFAYRDHVQVQRLGPPACTVPSPSPYQVSGIFFNRLGPEAWVQTRYGTVANPYKGLTDFNALIGGGEGNNSTVTYRFAKPSRYFQLVWGSLDVGNWILFYRGETLVGRTNGRDVAHRLGITLTPGANPSETLLMQTSEPYDRIEFGSNEVAFEWANMKEDDMPMCQP